MPKARRARKARVAQSLTGLETAFELMEALPLPVFFKHRDGRYLGVNRAWEEFFGIPRESFLGKRVADLYPQNPGLAETHAAKDRELWARPGGQRYEIPITTGGGQRFDTVYHKATFNGARGKVAGLVGAIVDVTARNRAQEDLRRSKLVLEQVFEHMDQGISVVDTELRVVAMNRHFCRLLDFPESLCRPNTPFEAFIRYNAERGDYGPGDVEELVRARVDLARRFEPHRFVRERPNGTVLEIRGTPLPGGGFVTIYTDITERARAERALHESEERFRRTFELAKSGLAHVGLDGRFLRVNPRLCETLGYSEAELIGKMVKDFSHPEDRDAADAARARVVSAEIDSARLEKRYLRKDGAVVWMSIAIAMERDAGGAPLYAISVLDDVTERKQAEVALRAAHAELERSNAELEQFAYVASHDLQEPLRMVSSYTQLLMRRHGEQLQGDAREFMNYVIDGAARMKQLIEDLLAYSRVGTHGAQFQPVPVEDALRRAMTNLRVSIEESGAAVTWDPLPTVGGDALQLVQLLQNLIGNALKFRGSAAPKIHVECADLQGEWRLAVRDNGIGIEPQYFERIFMLFQRLHTMGDYPGTGIGLAICKKVVERHGGRIWVESQPGEGSCFNFTLPKEGETKYVE